jgi:hypothetical protein
MRAIGIVDRDRWFEVGTVMVGVTSTKNLGIELRPSIRAWGDFTRTLVKGVAGCANTNQRFPCCNKATHDSQLRCRWRSSSSRYDQSIRFLDRFNSWQRVGFFFASKNDREAMVFTEPRFGKCWQRNFRLILGLTDQNRQMRAIVRGKAKRLTANELVAGNRRAYVAFDVIDD